MYAMRMIRPNPGKMTEEQRAMGQAWIERADKLAKMVAEAPEATDIKGNQMKLKAGETIEELKDGRKAVFDKDKKFIRYADE
jgi:hypothetical protein